MFLSLSLTQSLESLSNTYAHTHTHTHTQTQTHILTHTLTHTHTDRQTDTHTHTKNTPCLSLEVKSGQSLINLISLDILLMMKYGLFVTRSNSQISSKGNRFDSSVGCRNPCTCSCNTDKYEIQENENINKQIKWNAGGKKKLNNYENW